MPLTKKQKAREMRARQSYENMDVMLDDYSRNELESNPEDRINEVDLGSNRPRQDMIQNRILDPC